MKCFIISENNYLCLKELDMDEMYHVHCSLRRKDWRDYEVRNQKNIDTIMVIRYKLSNSGWLAHNTIFVDGKLI